MSNRVDWGALEYDTLVEYEVNDQRGGGNPWREYNVSLEFVYPLGKPPHC